MNFSYVALAALVFAAGSAVGFATGTRMANNAAVEESGEIAAIAVLNDEQPNISAPSSNGEATLETQSAELISKQEELSSQLEELSRRQEQASQREAKLHAQSEQLEQKLAALETLEKDLASMAENLRVDSEALADERSDLDKQGEVISAQRQTVLEREEELVARQLKLDARQLKLDAQIIAISASSLSQNSEEKLSLPVDQLASGTTKNLSLSAVEVHSSAPSETTISNKTFEEGNQTNQVSQTKEADGDLATPDKGPIAEVHFEMNSAKLTPGALKRAREAAVRLQSMEFSKVRIAGHTDTTGSTSRNQALSNARAEAVADIFVQAGLSRKLIEIVGFGETYAMLPVSTGDGISEPLNRCVGIFVE